MRFGQNLVLVMALVGVVTGVGCNRRKPPLPAQTHPPTIDQPTIPPVASQPLPTPPTVTPTDTKPEPPAPAPAKTRVHRPRRTVPPPPNTATNNAPKAAASPAKPPETTPADSNISAEVSQSAANQRRQQTEGMLQVAEGNLKKVNRTLSDAEESMQRQVRNFITQSRLAMQDGDLERAQMLANKAQLLSQELVK
jgi:hypothetical protein